MSDAQKQVAIEWLRKYDQMFAAIIDLIGDKRQLRGDVKTQAQEMLRQLKDGLETDCKELHRRADKLNQYEQAFVEPALRKAKANISIRVNTIPNGEWHSNLYAVRMDVSHLLHQLENPK